MPRKPPPAPTPPPAPEARGMQFYRITHTDGSFAWAATQADAKEIVKTMGGTWEPYKVPVDKPNLLEFLNEFVTGKDEADE